MVIPRATIKKLYKETDIFSVLGLKPIEQEAYL